MPGPGRGRVDVVLLERGLVPSREKAQALLLAGRVEVDGRRVDKPGTTIALDARVEILALEHPFVGRGGMKLAGALARFALAVEQKTCLDLGASTGGFTDCLLQRGALRVYAVDVGYGLLDPRLRSDARVVVLERTNARHIGAAEIPEPIDLAVADLAFISLRLVLAALRPLLTPAGEALLLVKPQFELGRGEVGKGVVRDPAKHALAIRTVAVAGREQGFKVLAVAPSPVLGAKGNREFFLRLSVNPAAADLESERLDEQILGAVAQPNGQLVDSK